MNIAITGATGFIGKYLCRELIDKNQLFILTRDSGNAKSQLPYKNINLLDLSLSHSKLKTELKNIDVFIHLAGNRPKTIKSDHSFKSYINFLKLTDKILYLLPSERYIRIINISSKSVYGPDNILPYDETQIPKPSGFYGLSKLIGEQQTDIYGTKSNFNTIHLRIGQVVGWGDVQKNNFVTFLHNALNKRTQAVWGDGSGSRSYIYAKDVINVIQSVIGKNETGPFNIAWPNAISHLELAKSINRIFNNDQIKFLAEKPSDTNIGEMDITKAKTVLHWSPKYANLEEALLDMKNDYEEKNIYWI